MHTVVIEIALCFVMCVCIALQGPIFLPFRTIVVLFAAAAAAALLLTILRFDNGNFGRGMMIGR